MRSTISPLRRLRAKVVPALFLAPVTLYVLFFFAYPLAFGVVISVENYGFSALVHGSGPFVGLANYREALSDPVTIAALRNTVVFTVSSVFFQVTLGLALALLLNQTFFLSNFLRRLVLVPWLLPLVATGTIFAQLFGSQNSLVNSVLQRLHLVTQPIPWLIQFNWAMVALVIVNIWAGLPFNTIVFYAGLQDLDATLFEASRVDGANAWQRFRHLTMPLLRPVTSIVLLLGIIGTVKVFDLVMVITQGGPDNETQLLSTWAYSVAFTNFNFGEAAAIGNILLIICMVAAAIYIRRLRKERAHLGRSV